MSGKRLSVHQFLSAKKTTMPFTGRWADMLGCPEPRGAWIIWGNSGSGKTTFALQLCKYLTRFGKVVYNSLEEGDSASLQRAFVNIGMGDVGSKLILFDKVSIPEMTDYLKQPRKAQFVVIDSFQYTGMNYADYKNLRAELPAKLFIFISHADGREPAGRSARSVRFDCDVKIYVEGYRASAVSRFGGGEPYTIWEEGAQSHWGIRPSDNEGNTGND
jgi:hypothetical protein